VVNRRDFIAVLPLLALSLSKPSYSFKSLLPTDCFSCSLSICLCRKRFGWYIAPKVKYWVPVGFLEANTDCEFMSSHVPIVGSLLQTPLKSVCRSLPFVTEGKLTQNYPTAHSSQDYMRVHARWYSMPLALRAWIASVLFARGCPCVSLSILESVARLPIVSEGLDAYRSIKDAVKRVDGALADALAPVTEFLSPWKTQRLLKRLAQLKTPVWFTEMVSPMWMVDVLSPDNRVATVIANALVNVIRSQSPALGALSCPYLTQYLGKYLPRGLIDFSFLCVGYWGRGYPRIGVVRHDDPSIAELLALARFHHLFQGLSR